MKDIAALLESLTAHPVRVTLQTGDKSIEQQGTAGVVCTLDPSHDGGDNPAVVFSSYKSRQIIRMCAGVLHSGHKLLMMLGHELSDEEFMEHINRQRAKYDTQVTNAVAISPRKTP